MRTTRIALGIGLALACAGAVLSCGEAATGHSPQQVWDHFEKAIQGGNALALPGLTTKEITKQYARDRTAYAGLVAAIVNSRGRRKVEVLSRSERAVRLKVTYSVPLTTAPDSGAYDEVFTVLLEKPKKNWKVTRIEGNVALNLPMF